MTVQCPYCLRQAKRVGGRVIYPHRPDLSDLSFFHCAPCHAYVGCHPDGRPMGRLANAALRRMKQAAHAAFDPLWATFAAQQLAYPEESRPNSKLKRIMRSRAYAWLSVQLGVQVDDTHIGMFDEAQCQRVIDVIEAERIDAGGIRQWVKAQRMKGAA